MIRCLVPSSRARTGRRAIACLGLLVVPMILVFAAASAGAQSPDVLTPERVASLSAVSQAAVSPDGVYVAYRQSVSRIPFTDEDGPAWSELHVLDTRDGSSRPFVTGKVNVDRVSWTPDGRGILFVAKRGDDTTKKLYLIPVDGGEARVVLEHESDIGSYSLNGDGSRVAFLAKEKKPEERTRLEEKGFKQIVYEEDRRWTRAHVARLDLAGFDADAADIRGIELDGQVSVLEWSKAGDQLVVALAPTPLIDDEYMKRKVHVVDANDGSILSTIQNPGKLGSVHMSPDGAYVAMKSGHDIHDPSPGRLMVAPASGGELVDLLPDLFERGSVQSFAWKDANTIVYVASEGLWNHVGTVSVDGQRGNILVENGGAILADVSVSADGRTMVFEGETPMHPDEVFVMDRKRKQPVRMTNVNPWLDELRLAQQEPVRFSARDGLEIEGVLVRPLDEVPGQRYPLVLLVHGGPESHHSNGWMTTYSRPGQMLAAEGVAVFHTNYRASTGRGVPFSKLDHADFAGKEFDDLVDAVDHLIETGLVDGDRVGITGGSYGGFATAWCTTYYTDRFAAGVMFVGISNNISKFGTSDIPEEMYLVHQRKRTYDEWEMFLERSPIYHAGKAQTPLLILHGKDDPRVNVGQSMELYRHVKTRTDTPVRLVMYPGEQHGNRKAGARYDYSLRMMRWFAHYLQGSGGAMPDYEIDYRLDEEESNDGNEIEEDIMVGEARG